MNIQKPAITALSLALALSLAACAQDEGAATGTTVDTTTAEAAPAAATEAEAEQLALQSGTYALDPTHTIVLAQWNHLGFSNPTANFADAQGQIVIDADDISRSSVNVSFPLDSAIRSFSKDFDTHLRSADFFDVQRFPEARFASTQVQALGGNRYQVNGDLSIKDKTVPVTLDVTINNSGTHPMTQAQTVGLDATGSLRRSDFGLGMAAPAVSDEVQLRITTEASIQGDAPAAEAAEAETAS